MGRSLSESGASSSARVERPFLVETFRLLLLLLVLMLLLLLGARMAEDEESRSEE